MAEAETKFQSRGFGHHEIVRQVLVRSATGVFRRDVRKLCLLEEELLKSIEESMEKDEV